MNGPEAVAVPDNSASIHLKVAIVHEWLESRAGSEQVFERMARCLPNADLYALTRSDHPSLDFHERPILTTALQRNRWLREHRQISLPLMPLAWKMMRRSQEYDLVVTSSHAFARYFPTPESIHLSYVHSPIRYAWMPEIDGRASAPWMTPARSVLKRLDLRTVPGVDSWAGNSSAVADRIKALYGQVARVIFPPVEISRFTPLPNKARSGFLLGVSRWIPYKKLDLVIRAGELLDMPVVIAGRGPEADRLRMLAAAATVPVRIVESPSDEELTDLYRSCQLLMFPAYEDFGIVPVEAQACGTPVVALDAGGSRDTVIDGDTGALSPSQTPRDLAAAARRVLDLGDRTEMCRMHAERFSCEEFDSRFLRWVETGTQLSNA